MVPATYPPSPLAIHHSRRSAWPRSPQIARVNLIGHGAEMDGWQDFGDPSPRAGDCSGPHAPPFDFGPCIAPSPEKASCDYRGFKEKASRSDCILASVAM